MMSAHVVNLLKSKKKIAACCILFVTFLPHRALSSSPQTILEQLQHEIRNILEIAKPSVVTISLTTSRSYTIAKDNNLFSLFNDESEERTQLYQNICSGLIYNDDGYIITKSCPVRSTDKFKITLYDGAQYEPEFIGQDYATGIAVLKINAPSIQAPALSDSENIDTGSWVAIIGNSMGAAASFSFGIVNENYKNELMEVSATVNPGNNGSPVFDIQGHVIGMVIARVESSRRFNMNHLFNDAGMVLSIHKVRDITERIIKTHQEPSGWIGIQIEPDISQPQQVLELSRVVANSPAAKAGLREGDILEKYNNHTIQSAHDLAESIKETAPGVTVPVSFRRGQVRLNVFVTVGRREPYIDQNVTPTMNVRGNMLKNFHPIDVRQNREDMVKIRNEIKRLEQDLFYLNSLINKANTE